MQVKKNFICRDDDNKPKLGIMKKYKKKNNQV